MQSQANAEPTSTLDTAPTIPTSPTFSKPKTPARLTAKSPLAQIVSQDFEPSERPSKRARLDREPPVLTAAAAMVPPPRQRSRVTPPEAPVTPNPAAQALSALSGAGNGMSKAPPALTKSPVGTNSTPAVSEPMQIIAENIQQPDEASSETAAQTSPVSISSLGSPEVVAPISGPATATVSSPSPMDESRREPQPGSSTSPTSPEGPKAFSYPGLPPHLNDARRHMSLPNSGQRQGTRSPSTKKHRCPYCATEFTRHHNLKSHLLTHSQEKPYVCSTCQSRFRRLHDLKRHTKLHTGERPHICPKCGRKFARGDALARHNKGPGGCAGRRASMGGYGSDDDMEGDESMEGMMYDEPGDMDEQEGNDRRPGIKRYGAPDDSESHEDYSRQANTYPPIQGRPPGGMASGNYSGRSNNQPGSGTSSMQAHQGSTINSHATGSTNSSLHPHGQGPPPVFAPHPITESPKPLSPGSAHTRQLSQPAKIRDRSPSMQSHYQQSQFSRNPAPPTSTGHMSLPPGPPQLPHPHGLQPPESRYTLSSQVGPTHPPTQPSGPPTEMRGSGPLSSQSNSLSSKAGSGENSNPIFAKEERLWSYVQSLETRMNAMQAEMDSLKQQLAAATQQPVQRRD